MEEINTDEFIGAMEDQPAIWDSNTDAYSNKILKRNAWEKIIKKFVPNFDELPTSEKNSLATVYQRKWKSLRDSYSREKAKQKKDAKSGTTKYRKTYVFFEQLKFLDTVVKSACTEDSGEEDSAEEVNIAPTPSTGKSRKRKSEIDQDEELFQLLKAKYLRSEKEGKDDDDKLFLLSLHSDLKSLPDFLKMNVKCQIMGLIAAAKQTASAASFEQPASSSHL